MAIVFITKEKTNWRYLAIVFILGVIVGAGTLWLSQNWTIPITQLPEIKKPGKPAQDETADWKTYRNEEYGFEFKYPKEYDNYPLCRPKEIENGIEIGRLSIQIEDLKGVSFFEYVDKYIKEVGTNTGIDVKTEDIFVGGEKGVSGAIGTAKPYFFILTSKFGKVYEFSFSATPLGICWAYEETPSGEWEYLEEREELNLPDEFEVFNEIPFTFRFLK